MVIPISEMWSWKKVSVTFRDLDNNLHECIGNLISESDDSLVIDSLTDNQRLEIPLEQVVSKEVIEK